MNFNREVYLANAQKERKEKKNKMLLVFLFLGIGCFSSAQIVAPNNSLVFLQEYFDEVNVTTSWTVPEGVYTLAAWLVAGGGSGGASSTVAGGGGAGGGTLYATIPVQPGQIFTAQVGGGGTSVPIDDTDTPGVTGGNSTFNRSSIFLQAQGGEGGVGNIADFPTAQGGSGMAEGALTFIVVSGQAGSGVTGGGSAEGAGAGFPGSFILPATSGGKLGGGGAGGVSPDVVGFGINSTTGGDGFIMISYVQQLIF